MSYVPTYFHSPWLWSFCSWSVKGFWSRICALQLACLCLWRWWSESPREQIQNSDLNKTPQKRAWIFRKSTYNVQNTTIVCLIDRADVLNSSNLKGIIWGCLLSLWLNHMGRNLWLVRCQLNKPLMTKSCIVREWQDLTWQRKNI